jgi:hypothetical protein
MSINVGQVNHFLSDGSRFYAYSGVLQGDVSVPASITLISIPNTGLKDSFIKIQGFFGLEASSSSSQQLGIKVLIDDIEVYDNQNFYYSSDDATIELFIPRQSKLEILSSNTTGNNTQNRGCSVLGWCL